MEGREWLIVHSAGDPLKALGPVAAVSISSNGEFAACSGHDCPISIFSIAENESLKVTLWVIIEVNCKVGQINFYARLK